MDSSVLVVACKTVDRIGAFQGYITDPQTYLSVILDPQNNFFEPRSKAEKDIHHKQLIPYVVLRYRDSIFSYVRGKRSSESRLVAMRSIGVGGHIEPADLNLFTSDREMYLEAARREVNEEVELESSYIEHMSALINDDSTDVGKVHLGIMHIWDLAEPKVRKREGIITQSGFLTLDELDSRREELEAWSQIALRALRDPLVPSYRSPVAVSNPLNAYL